MTQYIFQNIISTHKFFFCWEAWFLALEKGVKKCIFKNAFNPPLIKIRSTKTSGNYGENAWKYIIKFHIKNAYSLGQVFLRKLLSMTVINLINLRKNYRGKVYKFTILWPFRDIKIVCFATLRHNNKTPLSLDTRKSVSLLYYDLVNNSQQMRN